MDRVLILIGGMPATGKTRYARYLSDRLHLPLVCKDSLKEIMWERMHYDATDRDEAVGFGMLAYDLAYHFCEILMKAGAGFIFESNFTGQSNEILKPMIEKYSYNAITVLFDADIDVVHKRFLSRDNTLERHPGLNASAYYRDFEYFRPNAVKCRDFDVGDARILVDTTDFGTVSYEDVTGRVLRILEDKRK